MFDSIFSPAFGNRPRTLVGRDEIISEFRYGLSTPPGSRERVLLLLGQRGSGKTVLLLEMAELAQKQGFVVASPTIVSGGMLNRILEKLTENGKEVLKTEKPRVSGGSVSVLGFGAGVSFQEEKKNVGSFAFQLSRLCEALKKEGKGVLILVDEVQANHEELRQLIIAYQEMVGEQQNIALVLAGLPGAVSQTLSDHVLTFLNRAGKCRLNPLRISEIFHYYTSSFYELGIALTEDKRKIAAEKTEGSPYLMQLIGHYIVKFAMEDGSLDDKSFDDALRCAMDDYENDICQVSLNSLSDADRQFLRAMARDAEVSRISDIAQRLEVSNAYAQIYRKRMLDAGVIEQIRRGQIAFSLPRLRDYLLRVEE